MADSKRQIAPVRGAQRPRSGRRILLAGPPGGARRVLAAQLRDAGLKVIEASTPAEARAAAVTRPDMVLCDWLIGDLPAVDFCRQCRTLWGDDCYSYIVVVVPADRGGEVGAVLEAGADDFLTAPVVPVELTARLAAGERFLTLATNLSESQRAMADALARLQAIQAATDADLADARRLQQGLVGARHARFGPVQLSLLLRPAGHIGGDLVGFFPINARRTAFYSIDVSGHGVAAALLTARLAAHLSGVAGENIALRLDENDLYDARPPAEVARLFNRLIIDELETDTYFTLVYADLDIVSGHGRLIQAGHPHPLLQRASGAVESLGGGGLPIGLIAGAEWEEVAFELAPGDRLFITSDGITEAENPCTGFLGEEGLVAILRTNAFLSGAPFLESLCWSVAQFTQGTPTTDDISAILIERDAALSGIG